MDFVFMGISVGGSFLYPGMVFILGLIAKPGTSRLRYQLKPPAVTEVAPHVSLESATAHLSGKPLKTKLRIAFLLGAFFAPAQINFAFACACCTNTGQRYVENTKLNDYRRTVISEIRFSKTASLYTGEGDPSDSKGIANPSENYSLSVAKQKDRFVFSFRDEKKNEGTLTLAVPDAIAIFEVDTRDEPYKDQGLGPLLYKEWRLTVPFAGTGIFKAGNGGYQRITLIYQGRGRGCTEASHFTNWTISVHGPLGNYLFYGELKKR